MDFSSSFRLAVAAVECALAVHVEIASLNENLPEAKRLQYRMGISLGDVPVEDDDLIGDGVNIAARLEGLAPPGGVCISGSAYENVQGRLDVRLTDFGEKALENIARPVRVYAGAPGAERADETSPRPARSAPPRLSIVIPPFANLSGGHKQEYFVDGVTESLTTDLSRISGAVVIARNTPFAYRGEPIDVRDLAGDVASRTMVQEVRRSSDRPRNTLLVAAWPFR